MSLLCELCLKYLHYEQYDDLLTTKIYFELNIGELNKASHHCSIWSINFRDIFSVRLKNLQHCLSESSYLLSTCGHLCLLQFTLSITVLSLCEPIYPSYFPNPVAICRPFLCVFGSIHYFLRLVLLYYYSFHAQSDLCILSKVHSVHVAF